jgi:hypothetical protein
MQGMTNTERMTNTEGMTSMRGMIRRCFGGSSG